VTARRYNALPAHAQHTPTSNTRATNAKLPHIEHKDNIEAKGQKRPQSPILPPNTKEAQQPSTGDYKPITNTYLTMPHITRTHHSKHHSTQNPNHKELRRETRGTRYHNPTQPHTTEQHPNDNPKGELHRPTNCSIQAHNTKKKKLEHIKNHKNPQHTQQHIRLHMQFAEQPDEIGLKERHANIALQKNRCGIDLSSTSILEIIRNNKSPKAGKNQISTSLSRSPTAPHKGHYPV
jgi:hypothetical protein